MPVPCSSRGGCHSVDPDLLSLSRGPCSVEYVFQPEVGFGSNQAIARNSHALKSVDLHDDDNHFDDFDRKASHVRHMAAQSPSRSRLVSGPGVNNYELLIAHAKGCSNTLSTERWLQRYLAPPV